MIEAIGKRKSGITQKEIAQQIGVSQGIVSVVLRQTPVSNRISDDTKRRILQLALQHDYPLPAGCFRPAKMSNIVGIVVKKEISQLCSDLTTQLNDLLEEANYRCIVSRLDLEGPDPELSAFLEQIISYNYAGMICLGHFSPKVPDLVPKMLEHYPNVVFLNSPRGIGPAPCVRIDFAQGVTEAVKLLHASGRKRIALCLNDMVSDATKGRFAGYCAGLLACGMPMQPELCWVAEDYGMRGWEGENITALVDTILNTLIANCKPDALITSNDLWAVAVIRALKRRGIRVPEDIGVVGYGDYTAYCETSDPGLSSISHGNTAIAQALVTMLDDLISGKKTSKALAANPVEIKSFLIPRESC